jgi:hypothetical protein
VKRKIGYPPSDSCEMSGQFVAKKSFTELSPSPAKRPLNSDNSNHSPFSVPLENEGLGFQSYSSSNGLASLKDDPVFRSDPKTGFEMSTLNQKCESSKDGNWNETFQE